MAILAQAIFSIAFAVVTVVLVAENFCFETLSGRHKMI